jgi:hypothetical protein
VITEVSQRWRRGRAYYRPARETINTGLYEVAAINDDKTAGEFVRQHHYSMSYPSARRRFGLFRQGALCGVAVFSHPCNDRAITSVLPGAAVESLELGRFVLLDGVEANGESWFLAECRRQLRKEGFIGFISFADDLKRTNASGRIVFRGHVGTIYAASSAAYVGRATPRTLRLLPDGRTFSDRAIQKARAGERGWRYAAEELVRFGADAPPCETNARKSWLDEWLARLTRSVRHPGNHKYVFRIDKSVRLPPSLPYPKINQIRFGE